METVFYIGLDVHKKTISYCVKDGGGGIYAEGSIPATRLTLDMWMLPALRFPAGVLHGLYGDSRTAAHLALWEPVGPPGGTDEE